MCPKTLIDDGQLNYLRGLGKGLFCRGCIASLDFKSEIAGPVLPHLCRAALKGCNSTYDVWQCLPVDLERFRRVLCLIDAVSHHKGDRIANMSNLLPREDRIVRHLDLHVRNGAGR